MVGRGRGCPQRPVEGEPVAIGQLESLREHHLEDVARIDVLEGLADGRFESALSAAERSRLGQPAHGPLPSEQPGGERLRGGSTERVGPADAAPSAVPEYGEHAAGEGFRATCGIVGAARHRPGTPLPVVEGDELGHVQEVGLGKERIRAEALRDLLAPPGCRPTQISDIAATEGRQIRGLLRPDPFQLCSQPLERVYVRARLRVECQPRGRRAAGDADVAVPAERSLEEEGVATWRLLLIEEAEDAERRQQITGKLDGGRAAPKDDSGAGGYAWGKDCIRPRHLRATWNRLAALDRRTAGGYKPPVLVSPARRIAAEVLLRVEQGGAFANLALDSALRAAGVLEAREAALATELTYGTLRWQLELDRALAVPPDRPLGELDASVRTSLRLSAFELLHHPRVPARAVVDQGVEVVRASGGGRARGTANRGFGGLWENRGRRRRPRTEAAPAGIAARKYPHPRWF